MCIKSSVDILASRKHTPSLSMVRIYSIRSCQYKSYAKEQSTKTKTTILLSNIFTRMLLKRAYKQNSQAGICFGNERVELVLLSMSFNRNCGEHD